MSFYESYKRDFICRALGMDGFEAAATESQTLIRVLYLPSFHPEVCITVQIADGNPTLHFVGFPKEGLWQSQGTKPQSIRSRQVRIASTEFDRFWIVVRELVANARGPNGSLFTVDGMPCTCLVRDEGRRQVFEGNVLAGDTACELAKALTTLAFQTLHDSVSCELLRNLGIYLGLEFPERESTPSKPSNRIAVFGSDNDRDDLRRFVGENNQ